jgi:hypothetical protein
VCRLVVVAFHSSLVVMVAHIHSRLVMVVQPLVALMPPLVVLVLVVLLPPSL